MRLTGQPCKGGSRAGHVKMVTRNKSRPDCSNHGFVPSWTMSLVIHNRGSQRIKIIDSILAYPAAVRNHDVMSKPTRCRVVAWLSSRWRWLCQHSPLCMHIKPEVQSSMVFLDAQIPKYPKGTYGAFALNIIISCKSIAACQLKPNLSLSSKQSPTCSS